MANRNKNRRSMKNPRLGSEDSDGLPKIRYSLSSSNHDTDDNPLFEYDRYDETKSDVPSLYTANTAIYKQPHNSGNLGPAPAPKSTNTVNPSPQAPQSLNPSPQAPQSWNQSPQVPQYWNHSSQWSQSVNPSPQAPQSQYEYWSTSPQAPQTWNSYSPQAYQSLYNNNDYPYPANEEIKSTRRKSNEYSDRSPRPKHVPIRKNASSVSVFHAIKGCCGSPPPNPPRIYRPVRGCYERVNGPFKNPIPTKYQRCVDKFREKCCPDKTGPARGTLLGQHKPFIGCDELRQFKACTEEVQRLREERCKDQERNSYSRDHEDKCSMQRMESRYKHELDKWRAQKIKYQRDQARRQQLLQFLLSHRKELQQLKEENRRLRSRKRREQAEREARVEDIWLQEFSQREDERRWEQEKLRLQYEQKLLEAQTRDRNLKGMAVPQLEEMRRMFVPVEQGPKETYEFFCLEPQPAGVRLNVEGQAADKTTVQVTMGHRKPDGTEEKSCKITRTSTTSNKPASVIPARGDGDCDSPLIPHCVQALMKSLNYRTSQDERPLLTRTEFECGRDKGRSNGKEVRLENGPNFNGERLYGTIVMPQGHTMISPYYYDQPLNITF